MSRNVQLGQTGRSGQFVQSHVEEEREAKYVSNCNYDSDSVYHFRSENVFYQRVEMEEHSALVHLM